MTQSVEELGVERACMDSPKNVVTIVQGYQEEEMYGCTLQGAGYETEILQ